MSTPIGIPAALLAGLISFLSPCVLPLVPPYLCYLAGTTLEELQAYDAPRVRRDSLLASALIVAGFSTVFVTLGATASVFGQAVRQFSTELSPIAGLAIIVLGLHFAGVFRLGLLYRETRFAFPPRAGLAAT